MANTLRARDLYDEKNMLIHVNLMIIYVKIIEKIKNSF